MNVTEPELNQFIRSLELRESGLKSLGQTKIRRRLTERQAKLRHDMSRIVLEEVAKGEHKRISKTRLVARCARKGCGVDPTVWLLIIRLVMELLPLAIDWWQNRSVEEVRGGA